MQAHDYGIMPGFGANEEPLSEKGCDPNEIETLCNAPNEKAIRRIVCVLYTNGSISRTTLAQKANIQYDRLMLQIQWLSSRGYVKLLISDGRVVVVLTELGRILAETLSELFG